MRTSLPTFYLIRSKLRADLLRLFFLDPKASYYLRELARRLEVSPGALARELKTLRREEIFLDEMRGKQKYFSLNPRHPFYQELRALILKTTGP